MKKLISVIGARPQFIKHAAIQVELQKYYQALTIHTGQHFDENMSDVFFKNLNIPRPDYLLKVSAGASHGSQTGMMMSQIEEIVIKEQPNAMILYGDTNSTLAGTLVAAKLQIPQIHIEAGLRSYNRAMPEEINRIVADEFATLLICPTRQAIENLKKEGIDHDGIYLCGDVMLDTLFLVKDRIAAKEADPYYFATLHRPYNTDEKERLEEILNILNNLKYRVVFPVHPRVSERMKTFGVDQLNFKNIKFIAPVGYVESISLQQFAKAIITDSGGIQKEAYTLKKKCITIRSETEWTETLKDGWNTLIFDDLSSMPALLEVPCDNHIADLYGNGTAAKDIVSIIRKHF